MHEFMDNEIIDSAKQFKFKQNKNGSYKSEFV